MPTPEDREQRVDEAIAEYLAACEASHAPDRTAFLANHADVADSVQAFLDDQDRIHQAAPQGPKPDETATVPPCGAAPPAAAAPLGSIKYFGDYELLAEIARGGMGVVYRAKQVSLNRVVAVKLILAGEFAGGSDLRRFQAEAEAAANLDHPNILPIYEVGEHAGQQYFSMKLVSGGSLADRLAQGPAASPRALVPLLSRVCHAVHFAHQRGILHRDLKPANILLDADGTPYVTDFGLAKKVDAPPSELTQSGALVGTPSYMPPEQARGEKRITTAADIYSLGAILYEMLTGRPPFRAGSVLDTVLQVIEKEPEHPRAVSAAADRDLSVIALKCLDKDPARRYPSAAALADDLDRWANGEPILARPTPAWEKGWKWAKRRPAAAALLATCVLAATGGVVGLALSNAQIAEKQRETDVALVDRTDALTQEKEARAQTAVALGKVKEEQGRTETALAAERRVAYPADIALAASEWAGNRPSRSSQALDGCDADLRGWEWHHLRQIAHAAEREFDDLHGITQLCGFTPDGKQLLTTDGTGVRFRDFATGKVVREFTEPLGFMAAAVLSPDGKRVAATANQVTFLAFFGMVNGEVILWETDSGRVVRRFAAGNIMISALAFSPDGKWLATAGSDNTVRLWTADGSKEEKSWTLTAEQVGKCAVGLAFSPDGKQLAAGAATTLVWEVETKAEVRTLKGETRPLFSPDGKQFATVRAESELVVRDAATGAEQFAQRIDSLGLSVMAFSPDGKRLAVGGPEGVVRIWAIATKTEVKVIRGQQGSLFGLAFSPDGSRLVTSLADPIELAQGLGFINLEGRKLMPPAVRVWDLAREQDYRLLAQAPKEFVVHPNQCEVAIASGKEVVFFDPATGAKLRTPVLAPEEIEQLAYSPDGSMLAVAWSVPPKIVRELAPGINEVKPFKTPRRLQLFDAATGKPKGPVHAQEAPMSKLLFTPDGSAIATNGVGDQLILLDAPTGKVTATLEGAGGHNGTHLVFGPKGLLFRATSGYVVTSDKEPNRWVDGVLEEWDVPGGKRLRTIMAVKGDCYGLSLNVDGTLLAAAIGGSVQLIRLDTGEQKSLPTEAHHLTFSPNGQRLVTATRVGVKLWDPASGRDILTLGGKWSPQSNLSRVAFTNSSGLLLVKEFDGLRVYDGQPWTPPPPPLVKVKPTVREPMQEPPVDDRPGSVKAAVAKSVAALEANDPAAALLHAVAALEADPDPGRREMHRLRIALALQATPKLRPVVPPGAAEPTGFVADRVIDLPGTPNFCEPARFPFAPDLVDVSPDARWFVTWNRQLERLDDEEATKAGRSPWLLRVHDATTGKLAGPPIDLGGEWPWTGAVAVSPDGKRVAALPTAMGKEDVPRIWDVQTGKRIFENLPPAKLQLKSGVYFADGGRLLVPGPNRTTPLPCRDENAGNDSWSVWDLDTGKRIAVPEPVRAIYGWLEDPFFITASSSGRGRNDLAHVRDSRTLAIVGKPLEVNELRCAAVSADGTRVVAANSYWLGTWDPKRGERLHAPFVLYGGAKCLAITADGSRFAAVSEDRDGSVQARVWDGATGNAISPAMKIGQVTDRQWFDCRAIQFLDDGRVLLTLTLTTVRLWDARTGEQLWHAGIESDYGQQPPFESEGQYQWSRRQADAVLFTGKTMYVRRSNQTSQYDRWSLASDDRAPAELREVAEAVAGRRLDGAGNLQPIAPDELLALRKRLAVRSPKRFGGPIASPDAVLTHRPDPRVKQLGDRLADAQVSTGRRTAAANALAHLKDASAQAALMAALRDPDATIRQAATTALGGCELRTSETVQALVRVLGEDKDAQTRANAAGALHGEAAKVVTADLLRALKEDKAYQVRAQAAFALRGATAEPALLAALRTAFADNSLWVRIEAAMTVAVLIPDDKDGVGVLVSVLALSLNAKNDWEVDRVVRYLYDLGPRAAPAATALAKVAEKRSYQMAELPFPVHHQEFYELKALCRIGPAAKPAAPVLLAKLGEDESDAAHARDPWFRNSVAYTLACIGPDVVPELRKVFQEDKDAHRRRAAALALGFVGPPAKAAVADLEAEAKQLAAKEKKTRDEELLEKVLEKALDRIGDPDAVPVEKLN